MVKKMNLKNFIKSIRPLYYLLLYIKIKIVNPAMSGHLWYYISFSLRLKFSEVRKLKRRGFKKIKAFQPFTWRIGKGKDHAFRRYYTASLNNIDCFIKIGKNDITVANEAKIYNLIKGESLDFLANSIYIDESFDDNTVMIANEFISNLTPFANIYKKETFATVCSKFLKVLKKLETLGIIHADIHKGNIMCTPENSVVLLDFGISFLKGKEKLVDYNMRPGTFYIEDVVNKRRKYDDVYSFVKMIEGLDFPQEWLQDSNYNEIKKRIDKFSDWVQL